MIGTSRPLHPALAVLMAVALHAGVLVGSFCTSRRPPSSPLLFDVDVDAELEPSARDPVAPERFAELQATPSVHAVGSAAVTEPPHSRPHAIARVARPVVASPAPGETVAAETAESTTASSEPSASSTGSPPRRAIDLGLNGDIRRAELIGGWIDLPAPPERPFDGGLRQGLAALDAERGLSRSSAAHPAAYQAARHFAPATGLGIFELVADEGGHVISVTLASAHADQGMWEQVGQELQRLLKNQRLRVPPGAQGLSVRLRIVTGGLATDVAERSRSKRGAALGQDLIHPREMRDESTRSSLEPGKLSPTLGIELAGGGSRQDIRVVLLDERAL